MSFHLGSYGQNGACNGLVQAVDSGSTNSQGRILFYTGSEPATPQTGATGTLLATLNFNNPSFGSSSGGTSSAVTSPSVTGSAVASGTPGWFRVTDRNNNAVADGSVTATGGGGDLTFDNTTWVSGGVVTLTGLTVTFGM